MTATTLGQARRVQGLDSSLDDIVLHDGRKLGVAIGGSILPSPTLTRTIDGASTIEIPVHDPDRKLLRDLLLSATFDAQIDGMWFRYQGDASKSGETLTLTLIDRTVAKLQELTGPKSVFREPDGIGHKGTTRAEFIKSLFEEAVPGYGFYCPQLHETQPIKNKQQGKKAKEESLTQRGKGIGDTKGLTVKGNAAKPEQITLGDDAIRIAESVSAPTAVVLALIEALIVETEMGTLDPGNPLQATPASKSESNESDIHRFLTGGWGVDPTGNGAIGYYRANPGKSSGEIAQAMQGSAFPDRYNGVAKEAREWFEAFEGGEASGSLSITEPYEFKVGKDENYWTAAKRLAKEVNWRLFILPEHAVFMDEEELIRGAVRLAIDDDTEAVEDVDFDLESNHPVSELTITAWAKQWRPPPGSVLTLADYGPASLGPGDAPKKKSKSKVKQGLSSAVKASTHEGKGRYLLSTIEVPLVDDPDRLATITARKPTQPLPEPAPTTKSVSVSGPAASLGDGAGNPTVEQMLQWAENEAAKNREYAWGGGHANFNGPYDCSGGVSAALHVGGFLDTPLATTGLAAWGQAGKGALITVYVKTSGGSEEEHCAIDIGGNVFESGGGGENTNTAAHAGWGKVDDSQVKSFLTQFDTKRHPANF